MLAAGLLDLIYELFYGLFLLAIWTLTRSVYVDFRRRRSGYGVVFNSRTGEPVATAVIRLKNPQGLVISTVVSDKDGRYRIVAPKGEYFVEVKKQRYFFPSLYLDKKKGSRFYDNVLASQHILIQDYGAITKNIAVDPAKTDEKPPFSFWKINLGKNTQHLVAFLGTGAALYLALVQQISFWFWVIFAVYLLVMLVRLVTFKPPQPPFGTIVDSETGQPLPQVVVRLLDKKFNKLIETQTTSPKGRYALIVNHGDFRLMLEKPGYRKVIINFPNIKQDGFLLAKDVRMLKSEK